MLEVVENTWYARDQILLPYVRSTGVGTVGTVVYSTCRCQESKSLSTDLRSIIFATESTRPINKLSPHHRRPTSGLLIAYIFQNDAIQASKIEALLPSIPTQLNVVGWVNI